MMASDDAKWNIIIRPHCQFNGKYGCLKLTTFERTSQVPGVSPNLPTCSQSPQSNPVSSCTGWSWITGGYHERICTNSLLNLVNGILIAYAQQYWSESLCGSCILLTSISKPCTCTTLLIGLKWKPNNSINQKTTQLVAAFTPFTFWHFTSPVSSSLCIFIYSSVCKTDITVQRIAVWLRTTTHPF